MNSGYSWSIEGSANRTLTGLTKRRRRLVERGIEALALHPFKQSIHSELSLEGLRLEIAECAGFFVTYHVDHAARNVRIVEIHTIQ